jgi:hypothetical protein
MSNTPEIIETDEVVSVDPDTFTQAEINSLIASANASVAHPTRKVKREFVAEVVERTYVETEGLSLKSRNFAIRKAVQNYIDLQTKGIVASASVNHFDVLPPANPYSTSDTIWSEEQVREARAQWIAAEPGIAPEHRPIVASAYAQVPGSLEAMHAEVRVMALTSTGAVPVKVTEYSQAITASGSYDRVPSLEEQLDAYNDARNELVEVVESQTALTAGGQHIYDHRGDLAHRIERGDNREALLSYLGRSPRFQESLSTMSLDLSNADPYTQFGQEQFRLFYNMLENLPNSPVPVDYIQRAVDAAKPYDVDGSVSKSIVAGAGAAHVLKKLSAFSTWNADAKKQDEEFANRYAAIADLDSIPAHFYSFEEVLPAK